jgi:hypothetical protein
LTTETRPIRTLVFERIASRSIATFTATAILLSGLAARAEEPPPVCPNGYAWDAASGRCERPTTGYPTPLQQTTQATYVPQSVALSGPRVIKDWQEGDPVPDGYRVTQRTRTGLIVGGAVTFGVLYLLSVMGAAIVHDANAAFRSNDNADALFIPGIGPFVQIAKTTSATGNLFNVIDGVAQSGGLVMLFVGLTSPKHVLVRNDLARPRIAPMPMIGANGAGIGLVGQF